MYADVVDIAQIPAFLCRQTSLLETCAHYYKTVNIKKGQMCDAKTMEYQGAKLRAIDSEIEIWMTERGNTFGYGDLVVDMRNIQGLKFMGCDKVIFDATHSCQMPNQGEVTGGNDYYSGVLCRAAVAAGCHGIFVEVHPMPDTALSDAATQLPLDDIESWIITNIIPYLTEINHD
jgi:2-dehydro-3-deoxyphosphooctonate aldolase (KDO 8-P synthase)